ncbi:MAG TPA: hypothetical protein VKW06_05770 [Candidatus Angelobacter sp.]|nr:hypothetical protein [Candidatus Angelobacter sp.]
MNRPLALCVWFLLAAVGLRAPAQTASPEAPSPPFLDEILLHSLSGTSAEPNSVDHPMIMLEKGGWMLMFHGAAFINAEQQSGPRGYDKVFSTNWFMPMAQRQLGRGRSPCAPC